MVPPPVWKCPRRVGLLFPHECDRITPIGCPDCQNGQLTDDPYRSRRDRWDYNDYDDYSGFTEADGETLVPAEHEFEDDMGAS
jgi:hypothetical protein